MSVVAAVGAVIPVIVNVVCDIDVMPFTRIVFVEPVDAHVPDTHDSVPTVKELGNVTNKYVGINLADGVSVICKLVG